MPETNSLNRGFCQHHRPLPHLHYKCKNPEQGKRLLNLHLAAPVQLQAKGRISLAAKEEWQAGTQKGQ